MADWMRTGEESDSLEIQAVPRSSRRPPVQTPYYSTARTAPRAPHESRIGTDEAHERLQAAWNRARRDADVIPPDNANADQ